MASQADGSGHPDLDAFELAILVRQALELRRDGHSYNAIAEKQDCSVSTAHKRVQRGLASIVREPAQAVRTLELQRIDEVLKHAKAIADNEDLPPAERLAAMDRVLRAGERRSKLEGLDAPTKIEHRVMDAMDAQIEQLAAELGELDANISVDHEEPAQA